MIDADLIGWLPDFGKQTVDPNRNFSELCRYDDGVPLVVNKGVTSKAISKEGHEAHFIAEVESFIEVSIVTEKVNQSAETPRAGTVENNCV